MNQKLAFGIPCVASVPSMVEAVPPVTRLTMLAIVAPSFAARAHSAISPVASAKLAKLWNKLLPTRVPPSITVVVPSGVAVVPVVAAATVSGTITVCASAGPAMPNARGARQRCFIAILQAE